MAKKQVKNARANDEYISTKKTIIINANGDLLKVTYDTEALTLVCELTNSKSFIASANFEEVN